MSGFQTTENQERKKREEESVDLELASLLLPCRQNRNEGTDLWCGSHRVVVYVGSQEGCKNHCVFSKC